MATGIAAQLAESRERERRFRSRGRTFLDIGQAAGYATIGGSLWPALTGAAAATNATYLWSTLGLLLLLGVVWARPHVEEPIAP